MWLKQSPCHRGVFLQLHQHLIMADISGQLLYSSMAPAIVLHLIQLPVKILCYRSSKVSSSIA